MVLYVRYSSFNRLRRNIIMKEINVRKYACEFCDMQFDKKSECNDHELLEHKCPNCIHAYYVYGCELNCELLNSCKSCKFEKKTV